MSETTVLMSDGESLQHKKSGTQSKLLLVLGLAIALAVGGVAGYFLGRNETEALMNTPEGRIEQLHDMAVRSGSTIEQQATSADFMIDPDNVKFYVNGARRRPTDPLTEQEAKAALTLMFGESGTISSLEEADALAANPQSWVALNSALEREGQKIYPEYVGGVNRIPDTTNSERDVYNMILSTYAGDTEAAHAFLREDTELSRQLRAGFATRSVGHTTTLVPDKDLVIDMDADIDAGFEDYEFRKFVSMRLAGGINGVANAEGETPDIFGSEVFVSIDVTDVNAPFVDPRYVEVYSQPRGDPWRRGAAQLPDLDTGYLVTAAMGLYGLTPKNEARIFLPYCNGNPENAGCSIRSWGSAIKYFVQPYEWSQGSETATIYGGEANETIMSTGLNELSESLLAFDAHQVSTGTLLHMGPLIALFIPEAADGAGLVDPLNNLIGSQAIAFTWFGRGLTFSAEDALTLFQMVNPEDPTEVDFAFMTRVWSEAIFAAWGDEEVMGVKPGVLVDRDGIMVPEIVVEHPRDTPIYVNHDTPKDVSDQLNTAPWNIEHRDIRDNPDYARPITDAQGRAILKGAGKHYESVALDGPSFDLDGYSMTWDAGLTWKFNIGFDRDAGVTLYNIRVVLPQTAAFPDGEEVPYIWRLNIPNFGTQYASSGLGNLYGATFLESHFGVNTDLVPGVNCKGPHRTLPVALQNGLNWNDEPYTYTTYGRDPETWGHGYEPFAQGALGLELNWQAYPLWRNKARSGAIQHAICVNEGDEGHSMWHFYTAQRLRSLHVFSTTMSEAYNIVNRFEFLSDGKIVVSERLHGKPAIGGHGLKTAGGAYASAGRGGYAPNHLHWHVVAVEPHLRKVKGRAVTNNVAVVDLLVDGDTSNDPYDWYGFAQHWRETPITSTDNHELLDYKHQNQRFWRIGAEDGAGNDIGGLKICSQAWGPASFKRNQWPGRTNETNMPMEDTTLNHWWLGHDVWVANADQTRAKQLLISPSATDSCRQGSRQTINRCMDDEPVGDSPVVYAVMKKYHQVTTDELPVQNGFTNVQMEIWPHNLFTWNPNMLNRNMPKYNDLFQNSGLDEPQFTNPYDTEFDSSQEREARAAARTEDL